MAIFSYIAQVLFLRPAANLSKLDQQECACLQSMNTVMDDNRMLTLASNERIPLTPSMRLLLEINHMNHCSPATVSRGGVIYVKATDIGWQPVSTLSSVW